MMIIFRLFAVLLLMIVMAPAPLHAQSQLDLIKGVSGDDAGDLTDQQQTEQDLQDLIRLLGDPVLIGQLKQRLPENSDEQQADELSLSGFQTYFQKALVKVEERAGIVLHALSTVPRLGEILAAVWQKRMAASDFLQSPIYVIIFLFGGFGLEWLYWCYFSGSLKRIELSKPKSYGSVLKAATLRMVLLFGSIAVFTVGSIGLFVGFDWSAYIEHIVFSLLAGIIVMRFIVMITVFVLAPKVDDLRLLPFDKVTAENISNWIFIVCGIGLFAYLGVGALGQMGIAPAPLLAIEVLAGLVFTSILIGAVWQSDSRRRDAYAAAKESEGPQAATIAQGPRNAETVLWSALILLAFMLWVLEFDAVLWTLVTLSFLFPAIILSRKMVDHVFDNVEAPTSEPADHSDDGDETATPPKAPPSRYDLYRPIADRLIRFALVIVAFLTLGSVWDVAAMMQSGSSTFAEKVLDIIIDVVFALLVADIIWTWAKTAIDQKMSTIELPEPGHPPGPEARMATLLPMFGKVLMVTIIIMAALIILSSLGVNIGPLLAGAGVLGIALGFGAQALVKDIVAGVFFLIEDAFRVGEYIEIGDLRGTVEAVSVRSMRVRHHRGAIHTIPFGELNSLTNYSRDWVIMKLEFRVPFETDVKLVKKLIKKVSAKLEENEDYGQHILEPLKSQGVRRMEEFNMVIGVKFMATPGEQWTIRRDAYQQIRDAFEANGIHFAHRNVKVEVVSDRPLTKQEEEAALSAAQESVEQQMPAKAAPDEP